MNGRLGARAVRLYADAAGTSAVELALILPVLVTCIFGIWNVGLGLYYGGEVRHAVELGSRIYVVNTAATSDQLRTAVASHLQDVPIGSVTLNPTSGTVGGANAEIIAWSYQTTVSIPLVPAIPLTFSGSVDVPTGS